MQQIDYINQLSYFTYKHAIGGHANDGDSLIWKLPFENEADLMQKLQKLDIPFPETENVLQFYGYTFLDNEKIYLSIINNYIQIEVFGADGDLYSVTQTDVDVCKRIEEKARILNLNE